MKNVLLENNSNIEYAEEVVTALIPFVGRLDKNIVVSNPHHRPTEPYLGEDLHLRFYSVPVLTASIKFPKTIFGIEINNAQRDGFEPTFMGIVLTDEEGVSIAEIIGDTLYILFDLPHGTCKDLLSQIMEGYLEHTVKQGLPPEEREKQMEEFRAREKLRHRNNYITLCNQRTMELITSLQHNLEEAEQKLQTLSEQIVDTTRKQMEVALVLKELQKTEAELEQRFAEEYEQLLQSPSIERVMIETGRVVVFTELLTTEYKDNLYPLGKYRISILHDGSLQIINITQTRVRKEDKVTFHHPYVTGVDGSDIHLGTSHEGVIRLIAERKYAIAINVIIEALTSVRKEEQYITSLKSLWNKFTKKQKGAV
jgi:hypothetical protein